MLIYLAYYLIIGLAISKLADMTRYYLMSGAWINAWNRDIIEILLWPLFLVLLLITWIFYIINISFSILLKKWR